jgi:hypothetical protein
MDADGRDLGTEHGHDGFHERGLADAAVPEQEDGHVGPALDGSKRRLQVIRPSGQGVGRLSPAGGAGPR